MSIPCLLNFLFQRENNYLFLHDFQKHVKYFKFISKYVSRDKENGGR